MGRSAVCFITLIDAQFQNGLSNFYKSIGFPISIPRKLDEKNSCLL